MMSWITRWWRKRQRDIDVQILWPSLVRESADLGRAKAAFAFHAFRDPAWSDMDDEQIMAFVDRLRAPPGGGG